MLKNILLCTSLCFVIILSACSKQKMPPSVYPISPVPFTQIQLTDTFWNARIHTNREVTIPYGFKKCEEEGRMRNFARAAGLLDGKYEGYMPFDDTDVYKIIEGAAYSLQTNPDPQLDAYIDDIISKIAAAQEDDGYLTTWKTIDPDTTPAWWVEPGPRWHNLQSSHELYNAGHLYEAAYAHFRATGKKNMLNIALKNADLIAATFGPDKLQTPPGHQIIESGLIKLYRATGDDRYLNLAKFFLDARGDSLHHALYGAYNQDHLTVTQQDEAVGHAVRALYMYAAMTDIAALQQDAAYGDAVDKIWQNVVSRKMYITGGLGARHEGEAFGENYELPNLTAYNETCAAIANVYWNHRMFLLHGDAKYIDVLERTLYNGLIAGVSLQGDSFFYPNCLASDGAYAFNQGALTRKPWFDCSCCPSNVARFMPSVPDYIYAQHEDSVYVNLYMANQAELFISRQPVQITQQTQYPWDGKIILRIQTAKPIHFALHLRIPGWAQAQPVPSDLYEYGKQSQKATNTLTVNDEPTEMQPQKGYTSIERTWMDGDSVVLNLAMPVQRVYAHKNVVDDAGLVALERGPLVYCVEWSDNAADVLHLQLPDTAEITAQYKADLLGGVETLTCQALGDKSQPTTLTAIPYYAWSHRGVGKMSVWLQRANL